MNFAFANKFSSNKNQTVDGAEKIRSAISFQRTRLTNRSSLKKVLVIVAFIILAAIALLLFQNNRRNAGISNTNAPSVTINRTYSFNARNDQIRIVDKKPIKVTLVKAELNRQILIKGQPAAAALGKTFLIIDAEVENPYQEPYYLPFNDLVRWQDGDKLRAPDVHNALVLIDPIATKTTRVGFLVDAGRKSYTIKVGEINGEKQAIEISFAQ